MNRQENREAVATGIRYRAGRFVAACCSWASLARALLYCAAGVMLLSCAQSPAPIRLAISAFPAYELLYLAQEKGFYREEGVEVQVVELGGVTDVQTSLRLGQVDAAAITTADLVIAAAMDGVDLRAVWIIDYTEGADQILARAPIARLGDLRGKRVGLEGDSVGVVLLGRALDSVGMSLRDVIPVRTVQEQAENLLRRGEIDAMASYPPYATRLTAIPGVRKVYDSSAIPGEIADVLAVTGQLLERRPEDVRRILRASQRALDYLRVRPGEAIAMMARREHMAPEEFAAALADGIRLVGREEQAQFFGPGGKLARNLAVVHAYLRALESIPASPFDASAHVVDWSRIDPGAARR